MNCRRGFLGTILGAIGLLAKKVHAAESVHGVRLTVNGIELPLPKTLDIRLDVGAAGAEMGPVTIHISGGTLDIGGDVSLTVIGDGGQLHLNGSRHAISVNRLPSSDRPVVVLPSPRITSCQYNDVLGQRREDVLGAKA